MRKDVKGPSNPEVTDDGSERSLKKNKIFCKDAQSHGRGTINPFFQLLLTGREQRIPSYPSSESDWALQRHKVRGHNVPCHSYCSSSPSSSLPNLLWHWIVEIMTNKRLSSWWTRQQKDFFSIPCLPIVNFLICLQHFGLISFISSRSVHKEILDQGNLEYQDASRLPPASFPLSPSHWNPQQQSSTSSRRLLIPFFSRDYYYFPDFGSLSQCHRQNHTKTNSLFPQIIPNPCSLTSGLIIHLTHLLSSFYWIHLLVPCIKLGRQLNVLLTEKKSPADVLVLSIMRKSKEIFLAGLMVPQPPCAFPWEK